MRDTTEWRDSFRERAEEEEEEEAGDANAYSLLSSRLGINISLSLSLSLELCGGAVHHHPLLSLYAGRLAILAPVLLCAMRRIHFYISLAPLVNS